MVRRNHGSTSGTGRLASWWPVLLSLLVVLVPTICVLWFMTEALENRRAVLRRSLADADLLVAQQRLNAYWRDQVAELARLRAEASSASEFFRQCLLQGRADGAVCFDAEGQLAYPVPAQRPDLDAVAYAVDWQSLARLEFEDHQYEEAAKAWQAIAAAHGDPEKGAFDANLAARAILARARCLAKAGRVDDAIETLIEDLTREAYRHAVDEEGRSVTAAADLRALELIGNTSDPRFLTVAERLSLRLNDYTDPSLAAPQRMFLMRQTQELVRQRVGHEGALDDPKNKQTERLLAAVEFPTLPAEELTARFLEANPIPSKEAVLRVTQSSDVWQLAVPDRAVVALFRTEGVLARCRQALAAPLKSGARVEAAPPGAIAETEPTVPSSEAGRSLPGWRLEHRFPDGEAEPLSDTSTAAYFWTGILVIVTMSIFAAIIARAFRRQMRLTRLKNDLVATVSHELKTPLSSIRLLVDTLLDAPRFDETRVREYLELVAKENMRLTRLIDNFLAFSRMERNRHAFEFAEVRVEKVAGDVVDAVRQRHPTADSALHVEIADRLPSVEADADALVTVLLNLLDNAFKYSAECPQITVRAYANNGHVCLEVADNGMGLTKAAARKVFKRFYQVDRRISRETGGVGLGLSIVQFIVKAHGGTVRVRSRPGHGSTFTVTIPAYASAPRDEKGGRL